MEAFQALLGDDFCFLLSPHIVARTPRKRPIMTPDHADKMEITEVFQCPPLGRAGEGLRVAGEGLPTTTLFVPANSRFFFTANGGFLILFLFSLPSGRRGGGWWQISESPLSGISATTRRRIGRSPEKEQNFLYHVHDSTLLYI